MIKINKLPIIVFILFSLTLSKEAQSKQLWVCNQGTVAIYAGVLSTTQRFLTLGLGNKANVGAYYTINPSKCKSMIYKGYATAAVALFQISTEGYKSNVVYQPSSSNTSGQEWGPSRLCFPPSPYGSVNDNGERSYIIEKYTPPCEEGMVAAQVSFSVMPNDQEVTYNLSPTSNDNLIRWGVSDEEIKRRKAKTARKKEEDKRKKIKKEFESHISQAKIYLAQKKYDLTIIETNKVISKSSNIDSAYIVRAKALSALRQNIEAIKDLDKAIEIQEKYKRIDADPYEIRARIYKRLNYKYAQKALEDYLFLMFKIESKSVVFDRKVSYDLAGLFRQTGEYTDAIEYFTYALDEPSLYVLSLFERGKIYGLLGENNKAISDLSTAIISIKSETNSDLKESYIRKHLIGRSYSIISMLEWSQLIDKLIIKNILGIKERIVKETLFINGCKHKKMSILHTTGFLGELGFKASLTGVMSIGISKNLNRVKLINSFSDMCKNMNL